MSLPCRAVGLLVSAAVAAAAGVDACDLEGAAGCKARSSDLAALLQVSRGHPAAPRFDAAYAKAFEGWRRGPRASQISPVMGAGLAHVLSGGHAGGKCVGTKVSCDSQPAELVEQKKSHQYATWYNMPLQDLAKMKDYHAKLADVPLPQRLAELTHSTVTLAEGSAGDVARMMYEATKVGGVSEHVPKELRGVFWMKGNPVPEELMVIQHAQWHEEEKLLVLPFAPFMWSWASGRPKGAPASTYTTDREAALTNADALILGQSALSAKFSTCKKGREQTRHPIVCDLRDCEDDLAYGYMQVHQFGNLTEAVDLGHLLGLITGNPDLAGVSGAFTLQKARHASPGSMWRRTCQWGSSDTCVFAEAGSYDFVKIIDADGNFVQPWYDEFIEYMGDVPLMTWTGWHDAAARAEHGKAINNVVQAIQAGMYERLMPIMEC
mmetsp:Transcript_50785/g.146525  ORF Transcript_50785/g.146525 Transcript_50785/m.146525 type:complete len:436 (-) Transcript_50785:55-1362(-)